MSCPARLPGERPQLRAQDPDHCHAAQGNSISPFKDRFEGKPQCSAENSSDKMSMEGPVRTSGFSSQYNSAPNRMCKNSTTDSESGKVDLDAKYAFDVNTLIYNMSPVSTKRNYQF
jgi:hypothetical protein